MNPKLNKGNESIIYLEAQGSTNNNLTTGGSLLKGQNLGLNSRLEELKKTNNLVLSDQFISDATCSQLAEFIKENDIITNLECTNGYITGTGLSILSSALISTKSIKRINFSSNHITDTDNGFDIFCNAMGKNNTIEELNLSSNYIGVSCARHLSELLKKNTKLESIDLKFNNLGKEGCLILARGLETNSSIRNLQLIGNGADQDTLKLIEQFISRNVRATNLLRDKSIGIAPKYVAQLGPSPGLLNANSDSQFDNSQSKKYLDTLNENNIPKKQLMDPSKSKAEIQRKGPQMYQPLQTQVPFNSNFVGTQNEDYDKSEKQDRSDHFDRNQNVFNDSSEKKFESEKRRLELEVQRYKDEILARDVKSSSIFNEQKAYFEQEKNKFDIYT